MLRYLLKSRSWLGALRATQPPGRIAPVVQIKAAHAHTHGAPWLLGIDKEVEHDEEHGGRCQQGNHGQHTPGHVPWRQEMVRDGDHPRREQQPCHEPSDVGPVAGPWEDIRDEEEII